MTYNYTFNFVRDKSETGEFFLESSLSDSVDSLRGSNAGRIFLRTLPDLKITSLLKIQN